MKSLAMECDGVSALQQGAFQKEKTVAEMRWMFGRGVHRPVRLGVDDGQLRRAGRLVGEKVDNKSGIWFAVFGGDVADAMRFENAQHLQSVT
jgi:hypothetical protein